MLGAAGEEVEGEARSERRSLRSAQTFTLGDLCGDTADAPRETGEFCASPFSAFGCDAGDEGRVVATTEDAGVYASVADDTEAEDLEEDRSVLPALDVEMVLAPDDRLFAAAVPAGGGPDAGAVVGDLLALWACFARWAYVSFTALAEGDSAMVGECVTGQMGSDLPG